MEEFGFPSGPDEGGDPPSPQEASAAPSVFRVKRASKVKRASGAEVPARKKGSSRFQQHDFFQRARSEQLLVLIGGACLAFNSGFISGACLNALGDDDNDNNDWYDDELAAGANPANLTARGEDRGAISVAGFTVGFTNAALYAAEGDGFAARLEIAPMVSFLGGSAMCGYIMPRRQAWELGPEYGPTFILGALFLLLATIFALNFKDSHAVYYWASAANGLSNGITSMYSANLIRTCSLSGPITDIGLILGQLLRGDKQNVWLLQVLVLMIMAFFLGALSSFWASEELGHRALIFNCGFFASIGACYIVFMMRKHNISLWSAATGQWNWEVALDLLTGTKETDELCEEDLYNLFDVIDKDGSGGIDAEELADSLIIAGKRSIPRKNILALLVAADDNGDGIINRDEFVALLRQHLEPVETKMLRRMTMESLGLAGQMP